MVLDDLKAASDQRRRQSFLNMDHVIRDQSVSPKDEIQRTLTLPDPALAQNENTHPKDVQENTMDATGGSEFLF
jgi:hypothetical protein